MRIALAAIAVLLLSSCAVIPETHQFDSQRTYSQSKDAIWSALMNFFTENNVQIKTIEKDSGILYAEQEYLGRGHTETAEAIADCGKRPMSTQGPVSLSLNVFVREQKEGTAVTINTSISKRWSFGNVISTAPCNSKGMIEGMLFDYIDTHATDAAL